MPSAAKYTKEVFWAVASKGAAFVFYYGLVYYLTRQMTVTVWGDWSAFLALLNIILLISDQGISTATKRYVAQARDADELGGVVRVTLFLRILASLAYGLIIAFLIPSLLNWLRQPDYINLLQRSLLLIVLYGTMEYFKSLFEALHRLRFTFVVNSLEHGFKFLLVVLLFQGGDRFGAIITAFTIAVAIGLIAGLLVTIRTIPRLFASPAPSGLMRQAYLYSLPIFIMSIGGFIALEIDTLMLKYLRTSYDTGIYSAAKNIVMYLPHLSLAISMGVIPGLSIFDASTAATQRQLYYRFLGGIVGLYALISLGLVGFALFGMGIFFKPEYHTAALPLLALIPFVVLSGVSTFCGHLLDYRGRAWIRSLSFGVTIIANIFLNWWWIPKWGPVGAAAASSIAFMPYCALILWQAHIAFAGGRSAPT